MAKKSVKNVEVGASRMPGFNAEASLYTSNGGYRLSGSLAGATHYVQPAVCWYCDEDGCGYKPCKRAKPPPWR